MGGGGGVDLSGNAQALLDELLQAPPCAVAGKHAQVVEVDVAALVGVGDLRVVDLAEPVVGGDGTGVGQDQAAHGIGDGGVFLHPPVVDLQVVVHQVLVVQHGGLQVADLLPLFAVQNVGFGHVGVTGLAEYALHAVLDILHRDPAVVNLLLIVGGDFQSQQVDDVGIVLLVGGLKGLGNGDADLGDVEIGDFSVSFDNLIHEISLLSPEYLICQYTTCKKEYPWAAQQPTSTILTRLTGKSIRRTTISCTHFHKKPQNSRNLTRRPAERPHRKRARRRRRTPASPRV